MTLCIRIELPPGMERLAEKELVVKIENGNNTLVHRDKTNERFLAYMKRVTGELFVDGRERTAEIYMSTLRSFRAFVKGKDIDISGITADTIKAYERFLRGRQLTMNTISFYMRVLRAVYNKAVSDGICDDNKPFKNVYTGIAKTRKRALDAETLRAMKHLEPQSEAMAMARDMFMFSLYTRGMSFADMAALRQSNIRDGELIYTRKKTGQRIRVKWERCMQEIADRYAPRRKGNTPAADELLLPILRNHVTGRARRYRSVQWMVNYQLKRIARILGVETGITMYAARHSWACMAKNMNIPISVISDGMGHHSTATTQIYLDSIDADTIDRANMKIIEAI